MKIKGRGEVRLRPDGPKPEALKAESGGEVLGEETASPLPMS